MSSLTARDKAPWTVTAAIAGTFVLLAAHVFALVYPPHVPADLFHVVWGAAFCGLAVLLRRPRNWARVWLTTLIAIQFAGKGVVFVLEDRTGVLVLIVVGWAVMIAVLALLWIPPSGRFFRSAPRTT
ncbi:hypothetical protein [Actinomadura litoris]|uniref:hypothetical protein n=1 Tax=Actinomadura litoris TaxID=2678616 RepID=UPI001FA7C4A4|nr:hypothetical protein [Actinomadura litoris]